MFNQPLSTVKSLTRKKIIILCHNLPGITNFHWYLSQIEAFLNSSDSSISDTYLYSIEQFRILSIHVPPIIHVQVTVPIHLSPQHPTAPGGPWDLHSSSESALGLLPVRHVENISNERHTGGFQIRLLRHLSFSCEVISSPPVEQSSSPYLYARSWPPYGRSSLQTLVSGTEFVLHNPYFMTIVKCWNINWPKNQSLCLSA